METPVEGATPRTAQPPWREVALAALPAALHAVWFLGRLHPDELFQSLEIAFHRTYGFGITPWEWLSPPQVNPAQPWGIRNWAVPIFFSWVLKLGDAIGVSTPMGRRVLLEVPQFLLHVGMLGAVWRLPFRRVGVVGARWCLWLVALYAPLVWFGGRTMSESFSTAFLVWGFERLDSRGAKPGWWLLGGVLLGLAQVTRYGSAAAIVPGMAWLLVERRWKTFGLAAAGGLVVALGLGALDRATWGEWFHSLIAYFQFNVSSGQSAAQFGALPWWTYFPRLLVAPFAVVGLVLGARRAKEGAVPWLFVAASFGYLAILSATAHKEDRFVYPALIMLTVAGAPAFVKWAMTPKWRTLALVIAASQLAFFVFPSPFDVQRKEQFQLVARNAPATTGLVIMNEGMWGSTGYFYVGKQIPWCTCDWPQEQCFQVAARDARFNRGLFWINNESPAELERASQAEAAFAAAGFHVSERRGLAIWFER
ncbi:MAG: mannosyltransferase [Myxococcaceae bacterium]